MALTENEIASIVVDVAYHIHKNLGPGLLESVYEVVMAYELRKRGLEVERQWPIPIVWDNLRFEEGFRADIFVNNRVMVELKSKEKVTPVDKKQLLTQLKLTNKRLGF